MTIPPDGHTERLKDLERIVAQHGSDIARIQTETSANTEMIRALAPLVSQLATVAEAQRHLQSGFDDLKREWREDVKHFDLEVEKIRVGIDREERDSTMYRRSIVAVCVAAMLSPICTVVVSLILH